MLSNKIAHFSFTIPKTSKLHYFKNPFKPQCQANINRIRFSLYLNLNNNSLSTGEKPRENPMTGNCIVYMFGDWSTYNIYIYMCYAGQNRVVSI